MYKVQSKLETVLFTSDCLCIVMNYYSQTPSDLRQKMGLAAQRFLIRISNSECLFIDTLKKTKQQNKATRKSPTKPVGVKVV